MLREVSRLSNRDVIKRVLRSLSEEDPGFTFQGQINEKITTATKRSLLDVPKEKKTIYRDYTFICIIFFSFGTSNITQRESTRTENPKSESEFIAYYEIYDGMVQDTKCSAGEKLRAFTLHNCEVFVL